MVGYPALCKPSLPSSEKQPCAFFSWALPSVRLTQYELGPSATSLRLEISHRLRPLTQGKVKTTSTNIKLQHFEPSCPQTLLKTLGRSQGVSRRLKACRATAIAVCSVGATLFPPPPENTRDAHLRWERKNLSLRKLIEPGSETSFICE